MRVKIPKNVGEENFVNHVIHYGRLKRWAYKKALSIKHGSSDIDLEIYHSLYLQNLFALLDEYFDLQKDENKYLGDKNILYAKELRNSLIHRGLSNSGGISDKEFIYSILPGSVKDQSLTKEYIRGFEFYHELFEYLEKKLNPQILVEVLKFLKPLKERNDVNAFNILEFHKALDGVKHMPEWVKENVKNIPISEIEKIFSSISQDQENILRKLFGEDE